MYHDYSEVRLSVDLNQFAAELKDEILSAAELKDEILSDIDSRIEDIDLSYQIEEAISDADIDGRIESYVRYNAGLPDEDDVARIAAEQAIDVFRDEGAALVRETLDAALPDALRSLLLSLAAPPPAPAPAPLQVGDRVLVSGPIPGMESAFPRHGQSCTGTVTMTDGEGMRLTLLVQLDVSHPSSLTGDPWTVWIDPSQAVRHA